MNVAKLQLLPNNKGANQAIKFRPGESTLKRDGTYTISLSETGIGPILLHSKSNQVYLTISILLL